MSQILLLDIDEKSYTLSYKEDDEILLSTKKSYGLTAMEEYLLRGKANFLLLDPLLHLLEKISLYERIPTTIYVKTQKHSAWIDHVLRSYPYTQFYTGGKRMSVILLQAHTSNHAGHTQKKFRFKI